MRNFFNFLKELVNYWHKDKISTYSAALSYYALFALAPFFIICTALAGLILDKETASNQILDQISLLVGKESAEQIQVMIISAKKPISGIATGIISFILFLYASSRVFTQIQLGFNQIWGVEPLKIGGILHVIKDKFLSFILVFVPALLSLSSLLINVFLNRMSNDINNFFHAGLLFIFIINAIVSFCLSSLLFALVFKILSPKSLTWSEVSLSSFITAIFFTLGKFLLSQYLNVARFDNAFGPAGALIVILLWVYYSAQVLFIGAELTKTNKKFYL